MRGRSVHYEQGRLWVKDYWLGGASESWHAVWPGGPALDPCTPDVSLPGTDTSTGDTVGSVNDTLNNVVDGVDNTLNGLLGQ
jgi:hypothetical protein